MLSVEVWHLVKNHRDQLSKANDKWTISGAHF